MNVDLKICGITNLSSIKIAAQNNIKNLGFVSNNLLGPNTCNDSKIKELIKECDYYKISSVLLTRHQDLGNLGLFRAPIFLIMKILHHLNLLFQNLE